MFFDVILLTLLFLRMFLPLFPLAENRFGSVRPRRQTDRLESMADDRSREIVAIHKGNAIFLRYWYRLHCDEAMKWRRCWGQTLSSISSPLLCSCVANVHCYATISWRNGLRRESQNAVQTHYGKQSRIEGINLRQTARGTRRRENEQSLLLHCEMYRIRMHKLFHFLNLRRWHAIELCAVMGERVRWWRMSNAWIIIASCLAIICKLPERWAHVCACIRDRRRWHFITKNAAHFPLFSSHFSAWHVFRAPFAARRIPFSTIL